ncbi:MAG: phosphate ABC transporter permease PstA [Ignavibacteria bacterium]|nr:phosphate ABC transporter permease PstA [Ignavibacteria bacterium]
MIKKAEEIFFRILMIISTVAIAAALLLIIFSILYNGLPALSWEMISQIPKGGFYFGKEGGILNAIIGSLYLSVCSTLIALLIGLPVAMYMNVFMIKHRNTLNSVRFILDILWGIPSIVYGAFGFVIMIYFGLKTSLLAGIITVSLFIIPIMVRSMDEVLKTVPSGLLESSLSLGSTKTEISFKIFLRQCIPGIVTAVLLSFGRAIGDAASVLFTTGYTDSIPESLSDPAATLPLAIFFQLSSPVEEVRQRAFASAAVLTFVILLISIAARILSARYNRNKIKF